MNIDAVIQQIKTYAPLFGGRVAGAAGWELAQDQVWLDFPAAYVIPVEMEAPANINQTGLRQVVNQVVGIIVDLDNSLDRRGQAAATEVVDAVWKALNSAILWWRPDVENPYSGRGYSFIRMTYLQSNRARACYQFDYAIEIGLSQLDGFQPPSVPLTDINGKLVDARTGTPLAAFDAPLPVFGPAP